MRRRTDRPVSAGHPTTAGEGSGRCQGLRVARDRPAGLPDPPGAEISGRPSSSLAPSDSDAPQDILGAHEPRWFTGSWHLVDGRPQADGLTNITCTGALRTHQTSDVW